MDSKYYVFFTPYAEFNGNRRKTRIISNALSLNDLENIDMADEAAAFAQSLILETNLKDDVVSLPIEIGYLVDNIDPWSADLEKITINPCYMMITLRKYDTGKCINSKSFIVKISNFIFKLSELGISLTNNGRLIYAPSITGLVRDFGFEATPELRISKAIEYTPIFLQKDLVKKM